MMKTKPTILHLSTAPTWRGGEQQIVYLLTEMQEQGAHNIVICPEKTPLAGFCQQHGIEYHTYRRKAALSFNAAKRIKQLSVHADLLHAHDGNAHSIAYFSSVFYRFKLPIVVHRRVLFPLKNKFFTRKKFRMKNLAKVIIISTAVQKLCHQYGIAHDKLALVHSAIDIHKFSDGQAQNLRRQYTVHEENILIGYVAALTAEKDQTTFLQVAARLIAHGVKATFFLIGEGADRQKLEAQIADLNLQSDVIITGFRNDVVDILSELDLFLFTSTKEGLGTSVLDAFASKVPVVATDSGGIRDIIQHEKTGLMATAGDVAKLTELVQTVLQNPQLKQRLLNNSQELLQRFNVHSMANKTLAIYHEIINDWKN